MASFSSAPVFFHSFIVEGISSSELVDFAKSIKMDQAVRGASHCEVSLYQVDSVDKLEARNVFPDEASREAYVNTLSPPNVEALASMGIRMSSLMGSIVSNTLHGAPSNLVVPNVPTVSARVQPNKSSWPELKNTPSAEAIKIISAERPDVTALLVPQGSMVTMDVRMDRVRVYHEVNTGNVTTVPKIG